jgi:hypothetical protein
LTESHGSVFACVWVLFLKKIVPIIKNQAVNLVTNSGKVAERAFQFLVVLLIIFPLRIYSQQLMPPFAQKTSQTLKISKKFPGKFADIRPGIGDGDIVITQPIIYKMWNSNFLGPSQPSAFFCKKELQFENATSIPLRLRLGSLDYVNRLEGKEKWIAPGFH